MRGQTQVEEVRRVGPNPRPLVPSQEEEETQSSVLATGGEKAMQGRGEGTAGRPGRGAPGSQSCWHLIGACEPPFCSANQYAKS